MSVIRRIRRASCLNLVAVSLCLIATSGCATFGGPKPSTVAQGKYYSSGDPHYDEFFISLYLMQVAMADAPHVPESERRALAKALALPTEANDAAIGMRLHEEAEKLSHAGVHLRLDQNPAKDKFAQASATLRSSARPNDDPSARLLAQVEQSGTNLLRSIDDTTQGEEILGKLEPTSIRLEAGADAAFADTHIGKLAEVKKNLGDARQLIALMHTRATEVRQASESLLLEVSKAVNTDDGTLGPPPVTPGTEPNSDAARASDPNKKPAPKPHPKPKPTGTAPAPRPKPEGEAPAAPPKPSKGPPASRDFEP